MISNLNNNYNSKSTYLQKKYFLENKYSFRYTHIIAENKVFNILFNYINTLGFIHLLHILLNKLYNYMCNYTYIWIRFLIFYIVGYLYLPMYIMEPILNSLLGTLLIFCSILIWNNFFYKAYLNDKLLIVSLYLILFCIFFFFGIIFIIKAGLCLYKVLTHSGSVSGSGSGGGSGSNNEPSQNPTNASPNHGNSAGGPSGNSGPSSGGIESTGHDTRNNTEEENEYWEKYFNFPPSDGSNGEPEAYPEPEPDTDPEAEGEIEAEPSSITVDDVKIAEIEQEEAFLALQGAKKDKHNAYQRYKYHNDKPVKDGSKITKALEDLDNAGTEIDKKKEEFDAKYKAYKEIREKSGL